MPPIRPVLRAIALLATCALALAPAAHALDPAKRFSDYVIDNWNAAQGIPQISVQSITQDRAGYIWVGTQNGIARFDGLRFSVHNRANAGIRSFFVRASLATRDGSVWFGTDRALLRHAEGGFTEYEAPGGGVEFRALAELPDGTVLASSARGVFVLGPAGLEPHPSLSFEQIGESGALLVDGGRLWVGVQGAVLELEDGRIQRHENTVVPERLVVALARQGDSLVIGNDRGLARLEHGLVVPAFPASALSRSEITSLLADRDGNLWIGTSAALWRHSAERGLESVTATGFPAAPRIISMFEDRDGNLWLGSVSESLFRVWNGWIRRLGAVDGFTDPLAWSLVRDAGGRMLVGTNSNVLAVDGTRVEVLIDGRALPNPAAYELYVDSRSRLWIGTRAGVAVWQQGRMLPAPELGRIGAVQVNVVIEHDGWAWIGTQRGLFRWQEGTTEAITGDANVPWNRIRALHPLGPDRVLLGTEAGVREWRDDALSIPAWSEPVAEAFVTSIDAFDRERLLVTTLDQGIALTDQRRAATISEAQGLSAPSAWLGRVFGQNLYLSSMQGVYRVELASLDDYWLGRSERVASETILGFEGQARGGMRTRCCNGGARSRALLDAEGIWLPHAEGLLHLDVGDIHAGARGPHVLVESLRHAGAAVPLGGGEPPLLAGAQRDVEIEYSAIEHRDPVGVSFRYRLDGFDAQWREAGATRRANYTNLPPGQYAFRLAATSSTGFDSPAEAVLRFAIAPRWHERTDVRVLGALLLVALAWLALQHWASRYRQRQQVLEQLVAERTNELALANSRLRESNQMLVEESRVDALTGLVNRRHALSQIDTLTARWHTPGAAAGRCTLFAMLNVDYMKRLNERYGSTGADGILRQFAHELERLAGPGALVARWGGDEFVVVYPDVERDEAPALAERLRRLVVEKLYAGPDGRDVVMPCSVGYACYPLAPGFEAQVPWIVSVELADAAVQQVKLQGRNSWAGVEVAPGADPAMLRRGTAGRTAELTRERVLSWRNLRRAPG